MSQQKSAERALWLSLRPSLADKIIHGSKSVELRRVRPRIEPGNLIVLYAATPVKAILGLCALDRLEQDHPAQLWNRIENLCGISADWYQDYFRDAERAIGIHVLPHLILSSPIGLDSIRSAWPGFMPPQSFRYVYCAVHGERIVLATSIEFDRPLVVNTAHG